MPGAIGLGGTPASARLMQEPQTPATEAGPLKPMCRTGSTAHCATLHSLLPPAPPVAALHAVFICNAVRKPSTDSPSLHLVML